MWNLNNSSTTKTTILISFNNDEQREEEEDRCKTADSTQTKVERDYSWLELPQQLIKLIARNQSMLKDLYCNGVTKSWRKQSIKCRSNSHTPPWLQLSADYASDFVHNQSLSSNMPFKVPSLCFALSSYPYTAENQRITKAKYIVMVLTGVSHPAFIYFRTMDRQEWIKRDSNIVDPNCSDPNQRDHLLRFCNGIWLEEKFYALSVQGTLVVIEDIDSDVGITRIGKRVVPSVASKHYRECMIESGGNILIVFLISRNSINKVDHVEVYELDTADLTWIKKEKLGDLTVFLGDHCFMGVSAARVGCRRNCIYFSICSINGWWVYDMKTGIITPTNFLDWVYHN